MFGTGFGRFSSLLAQLENCITVFDDFKPRAFYIVSFPWTCSFTEHGPFENFNVEVVILVVARRHCSLCGATDYCDYDICFIFATAIEVYYYTFSFATNKFHRTHAPPPLSLD